MTATMNSGFFSAKVRDTKIVNEPFDHVYFSDFFSADFYLELLSNLPALEKYRQWQQPDAIGPDGRSTRYRFFLYPEHVLTLPSGQRSFWRHFSKTLYSNQVQEAYKSKFQAVLEKRFNRSIDQLHFLPRALLLKDLRGYKIAPHPDQPHKAITTQFYLPNDNTRSNLGTHLHYGDKNAAEARSVGLSFMPASGYAFAVHENSWHSVQTVGTEAGVRDSLLLNYYVPLSSRKIELVKERFFAFRSLLKPNKVGRSEY